MRSSLGNVVTNLGQGGCTHSTVEAYKVGITYAVTTIARRAPRVAMYVDAGHGGWLGFESNAQKFARVVHDMGIMPYIRGFSTNGSAALSIEPYTKHSVHTSTVLSVAAPLTSGVRLRTPVARAQLLISNLLDWTPFAKRTLSTQRRSTWKAAGLVAYRSTAMR